MQVRPERSDQRPRLRPRRIRGDDLILDGLLRLLASSINRRPPAAAGVSPAWLPNVVADDLRQQSWAIITAAVARDQKGLSVLIDDLDEEDVRDVLAGVAMVAGNAITWHEDSTRVLALLREQLLRRQTPGSDSAIS